MPARYSVQGRTVIEQETDRRKEVLLDTRQGPDGRYSRQTGNRENQARQRVIRDAEAGTARYLTRDQPHPWMAPDGD